MTIAPLPRQRRHTLHFLREIRSCAPVFLDTEVDMTRVRRHREHTRHSMVTYVLHTAARVLAAHPDANAAIRGTARPRVARYSGVNAKLTLDRTLDGQRVVLSAVLPDPHLASLADIQRQVEHYRDGDPETMPEFAATRALQRLPWPFGGMAFRFATRSLRRRADAFGTFAVTSLGHRPVDGFYSVGGTTITLGVGRVTDRPVVRDGQVVVAPVLRLCLTFDHRVLDGAEAADVLAEIRTGLETFAAAEDDADDDATRQARRPVVSGRE